MTLCELQLFDPGQRTTRSLAARRSWHFATSSTWTIAPCAWRRRQGCDIKPVMPHVFRYNTVACGSLIQMITYDVVGEAGTHVIRYNTSVPASLS
jgi:hypothetical protein